MRAQCASKQTMLHKVISVEGNIGAGKTTLATLIAAATGRKLVLEQFEQNPFLANFYAEPDKYAFHTELYFLAKRYEQWRLLANEPIVADYSLAKSLYFAEVTLKGAELEVFKSIYKGLMETAHKPDLIIYLDRSTEQLNAHILQRGRKYEQAIPAAYLKQIQDNYLSHLSLLANQPIVVIDARERDFREGSADLDWMLNRLQQPYPNGITRL
jgi:deoxyadenosine/deoxycytidine kinase